MRKTVPGPPSAPPPPVTTIVPPKSRRLYVCRPSLMLQAAPGATTVTPSEVAML